MTPDPDDDRLDLAAWTAPPPPPHLADRVLATVHGRAAALEPARSMTARWWRGAVMAGAVVAAAGLTFALWPVAARARRGQLTAAAPGLVALADDVEAMVEAGAELAWQPDGAGLRVRHDAGIVTYRHRGDARLEVVTPAGTLTSERAAFRVEAPMKRDLIVGGSAATVAALMVVAVYQGRVQATAPGRAPVAIAAGQELALGAPPAPTTPTTPTAPPRPVAVAKAAIDRVRRAALVQEIAAARQAGRRAGAAAATGPGTTVGAAPASAGPPALTRDEIRAGFRELVPMVSECYETELERDPRVRGTVTARLTIDSEPELGTIVTVGGLDIADTLGASSDFHDCLTATLEAMVLPPIADGGHLEVTYPFTFSANDDDAPAAPAAPATKPAATTAPTKAAPATPAAELAEQAQAAALEGTWDRALALAEQGLRAADLTGVVERKLVLVAALAACNLKHHGKARQYFKRVPESAHSLLRQRCLAVAHFDPAE